MIGFAWDEAKGIVSDVTQQAVIKVANSTWDEMKLDRYGNLNVLVVWYAGEELQGWLLTDTIMLASYNPELQTTTFLSIPRDLTITYYGGLRSKINGLYRAALQDFDNSHVKASEILREKVSEITGVDVKYSAFVDFKWFENFVDTLWWVTIDVPIEIDDPYYPDAFYKWYDPLFIPAGQQKFDWETALKYVRSRKTTSDFSRAIRQQQIVQWIVDEILASVWSAKIGKLKELSASLDQVIKTNITNKEILSLVKYMDVDKRYFSFVYSADCDLRYLDLTEPWCVLYFGNRDDYNGASTMLPDGAKPGNIDYYKHTKDFAFRVIHNQEFLLEWAPITIYNAIDTDRARSNNIPYNGVAGQFAIDLKLQAFTIEDIDNAPATSTKNRLIIPWYGRYPETVAMIKTFIDIDEVEIAKPEDNMTQWIHIYIGNEFLK